MLTKLIEQFYSLQGEGPRSGTPSYFFRLSGCNLKCDFCDTKYAWSDSGTDLIFADLNELKPMSDIVITGGEPILHYNERDFLDFYLILIEKRSNVYFETNGLYDVGLNLRIGNVLNTLDQISKTILNHYTNSDLTRGSFNKLNFIVSPKLDKTCYYEHIDLENVIDYFKFNFRELKTKYYNIYYKFVYDPRYKDNILSIISNLSEIFLKENVYIMPKTPIMDNMIVKDEMINNMAIAAEFCKEYGVKYSPRLHIDIWGNKKGA